MEVLTQRYEGIYRQMRERNSAEILSNGFSHDEMLMEPNDDRRCLALYSFEEIHKTEPFYSLIQKCSESFGNNHIVYRPDQWSELGKGSLHHTFMQLVTFAHQDEISQYESRISEILEIIEKIPKLVLF